ncbi:MAG: sensor domain-containing diguanylate cyclase [Deltaproteobacteria bacterium]|nr:MAG: sensor domain-containing diguanylate cyclase [Deltaproteobacteria bacterium]
MRLQGQAAEELARAAATQQLAVLRAQVEGELASTLHLTRGMIAHVAIHPDMTEETFRALAEELRLEGRHLRNLGLAPDNVLRFVHPREGNEAAIGLRYADLPEQWESVQAAIELGSTLVAGPFELVQGGEGLAARTPIHVRNPDRSQGRYWGLASIVIDVDSLFEAAGVHEVSRSWPLAMRGRDGLGMEGDVFLGDPEVFAREPVLMSVPLPNGSWVLALELRRDLAPAHLQVPLVFRLLGLLLGGVLATLVVLLMRARFRNRQLALHDDLTGLPNLRYVRDRLERLHRRTRQGGEGFAVVSVDLDGFKSVNDAHGHQAGDRVLGEVARRLRDTTRVTDMVARVGGDEFLVLLPGIVERDDLERRVRELSLALADPIALEDDGTIEVAASIGGALCARGEESIDDLLQAADARMYRRKRSRGR